MFNGLVFPYFIGFVFVFSNLISVSLEAETWKDLEKEKETEIYGSEKSLKFTSNNIFYEVEDWKDHYSVKAFGLYRYYDYPKSKSRTVFPFYYGIQSKIDNREYKRIINYTITKKNEDTDKAFYPFSFWGKGINSSYHNIVPFYFYSDSYDGSKFGFPILPLVYYQNRSREENSKKHYSRLLTFFHFETNDSGNLNRISFLPFFYYAHRDFLLIPIFLYYQDYYIENTKLWLGPVYYSKDVIKDESLFTIFPLLLFYKTPDKKLDLILPLYVNYSDEQNDYHINFLWYTKSNSANLDVSRKDKNWYLDYDFGILYNLFGFSQRTKIINAKQTIVNLKPNSKSDTPENPKLVKKREFNRESSDSFIGYSALFGIFSFERGDTKRHIRLLPFAWFTWDEASEDKVVLLPPFFPIWLSYKSDDLEYKVLFPFYGKQKDNDSEIHAFLINAYIGEEWKENHLKERSFVWPFINMYESDLGSGHRVLPFYLHRKRKIEDTIKKETYTFFSHSEVQEGKDFYSSDFFFWPLWISFQNILSQNQSNQKYWVTPFFYHKSNSSEERTNLLWFMDWGKSSALFSDGEGGRKKELSHLMVFPFYYEKKIFSIIPFSFNWWNSDSFKTFTLLQYLHLREKGHYYNFLFLVESEKTESTYTFRSLGDYLWSFRTNQEGIARTTFLWLGYDNQSSSKKIVNFFPLFRVADSSTDKSRMFGPFLYYNYDSEEENTELVLLGLGYYHNKTKSDNQYGTYILLGALYQEATEKDRGFKKRGSLWGWLWEYQIEEETGFEKFSILKIFSYTKETNGTRKFMGFSIE
ncbi:LA_1737 family protein [Leptospira kobayashii]